MFFNKEINEIEANKISTILSSIFWIGLAYLVVITNMAPFVLSTLFSLFIFWLVNEQTKRYFKEDKYISTLISFFIIISITFLFYKSFSYMIEDFKKFIIDSEPIILQRLSEFGVDKQYLNDISGVYSYIKEYFKTNLQIFTSIGASITKITLGMIFGIIFFFSDIKGKTKYELTSLWNLTEAKITYFGDTLFTSFRTIMKVQVIVAIMNTTIISIFALGITYLIYGHFLPYWYIIIPLVSLFSLIPVIGNILINILIGMAAIQISVYYLFSVLIYFFIIHKLELLVIGKYLNTKINVPLAFILLSMMIGEMLFHSVAGIMLGMVLLISFIQLLKNFEIKEKKIEN